MEERRVLNRRFFWEYRRVCREIGGKWLVGARKGGRGKGRGGR